MRKVKVLHQVLDPSGIGGVSSEFKALEESSLTKKYEFSSMILSDPHRGLNLHDIRFYFDRIKETQPDIVHVRGAAVDGLNAIIAAKIYGKCKIFTAVHGMWSDIVFIGKLKHCFFKYFVERAIFSLSDGISCVCANATNRRYFDRYRKKMLPYVYNRMPYYDPGKAQENRKTVRGTYDIDENAIVGLFLGRLSKEKGLDDLCTAICLCEQKLPDNFVLLVVGSGDYLDACKQNLKNAKCKVIFTGSQTDVSRFYQASDFFILPSLHENHSISLLEACAAQLPSIATECGGNSETITNSINGIIVPVGNPHKLSEAIVKMIDGEYRRSMKDALKNTDFARFSNTECDNSLDKAYCSLLKL